MQRPKTDRARKRNLLRRVRRQRLKYITILPSLITLLNGLFGFAAIGFASLGTEHFVFHKFDLTGFSVAGYMIFFAMIADMLDGRVARMSHTTSSFGGQLDSLCDMVSFGIAPAFLILKVLDYNLAGLAVTSPLFEEFLYKLIWLSAGVYMACAAIRLARFNVENEEDETAHMSFMGLPTPAAAGVVASLVVFYGVMLPELGVDSLAFSIGKNIVLCSLPFIAIGVAVLMISRIRYPHLINMYLKGRKPLTHLIWFGIIAGLIWLFRSMENALVITFCGFALSGFVRWLYHKITVSTLSQKNKAPTPSLSVTESPE